MNKAKIIGLSLIVAAIVVSIIIQSNIYLGWNMGWRLHVTQQFLAGGNYVTNFMDINPPFLIYEYIPAVLLAKWTGLSAVASLRITVYLFAILSLALCHRIIQKTFPIKDNAFKYSILVGLAIIFFLAPNTAFSQREHLILLFISPYLLYATLLARGKAPSKQLAIITGCFAAIGFCTDLSFLGVFLLTEIFLMIKHRRWKTCLRIDTGIVLTVLAAYISSIFIWTPNYIHIIFPLVISLFTKTFHDPLKIILLNYTSFTWLVTILLLAFHFKRSPYKSLLIILLIASTTSYALFFLARKTWYYHTLPTLSFCFLMLLVFLIDDMKHLRYFSKTENKTKSTPLIITILTYGAILLFPANDFFSYTRASIQYRRNQKNEINLILNYIRQYASNKTLYIFSTTVEPGPTIELYTSTNVVNNIMGFWMLPGILKNPDTNAAKKANTLMINTVINTFNEKDPDVVMIQVNNADTYIRNPNFNYIYYFSKDPRFKKIWSKYHYTYQINDFAIFMK